MAGVLTDEGERDLLDLILRQDNILNGARWLALSTTPWSDAGSGGSEPTDSAYARQIVTMTVSGRSSDIQNSNTITFPTANEDWGTIAYWAIFTGSSTGTIRMTGTLDVSRVCNAGDSIVITPGQIDFTIGSDTSGNFIQNFYRQRYLYALIHGATSTIGYNMNSDGSSSSGGYVNSSSLANNTSTSLPSFTVASNTTIAMGLLTVDPSNISGSSYTNGRISNETSGHYTKLSNQFDYGIARFEPFANISGGGYPHTMTTVSSSLNFSNPSSGYTRELVSFNAASTSSGVTSVTNSNTITFNTATSDWGTIYGWALYCQTSNTTDYTVEELVGASVTDGTEAAKIFHYLHPIMVGKFNTARTVNTNDVFRVNAGDLVIRFD